MNIINLIIEVLGGLFRRAKPAILPEPLTLPYPEEHENPTATVQSVNIEAVILQWLVKWDVPDKYFDFWREVRVQVVDFFSDPRYQQYPAITWAEDKRTEVKPVWANAGVLAHEMAHVSYSLLSVSKRLEFGVAYRSVQGDKVFQLFCDTNSYRNTNEQEAHAEIYRYLGMRMPPILFQYYPNLF